ncbi:uncharacterized protein E0L32_006176 [Thyridium curvatum]|uniref:Uncharacterized protein n=1 Tax=Thyridium curvatum TaxID=1093900 RepID=A0A507B2Z9_9PEZI|nr:uncharacterized protein E0L32_006176 [Thyridium curvatum]TPX13446.1 hypothetical protein E0L32_006176 [Thyridium curvatum]
MQTEQPVEMGENDLDSSSIASDPTVNVAKPDTYKELVEKYPDMRYQVGRACAVAGYTDLYRSLELLPDVSIAEEARDNAPSAKEIYSEIVSSHVRYAVMDDYNRSVNLDKPRPGAQLNGDTVVRSSLDVTMSIDDWVIDNGDEYYNRIFDITEEGDIGPETMGELDPALKPHKVELLYSPIPYDLPTTNKELLIRVAAYHGNIDRYARLRRPGVRMSGGENYYVQRGIYHNSFFAKWWMREVANMTKGGNETGIRMASTRGSS